MSTASAMRTYSEAPLLTSEKMSGDVTASDVHNGR
jgi:hypothetical protein